MPTGLTGSDHDLLLDLLRLPTVSPLETDERGQLWAAQRRYAAAAAEFGCAVVRHQPPDPSAVLRPDTPLAVRAAMADRPGFLDQQPSLVLRLGPAQPAGRTVMFNVHLDTVAGTWPADVDGRRFTGRGAIDAKGPAVALLAGVRAAAAADPSIGSEVTVLIQAVAGEEGGALGTIGTRPLIELGFTGRLNVFCEPTGLRYLPRATAAMTACVRVSGEDAIDDRPQAGHNATVLLGWLAQFLAHRLGTTTDSAMCVAGMYTGQSHNKVYGSGTLLLNLPYADAAAGPGIERAVDTALRDGLAEFAERFADIRAFARTAADATAITELEWHKRGLPALSNTDPWGEALLDRSGLRRWPDDQPAFTCDAIWCAGLPDAYTVVLGPGSLSDNRAHAAGEFAELSELDEFAAAVTNLLRHFAEDQRMTRS